jgi:hypothetical protein
MLFFLKRSEINYEQVCKRKTSPNKNAQNVKDVSAPNRESRQKRV